MGSFWSEIGEDRTRRQREQQRIEARIRKETRAEQERAQRADAAADRARRTEDARRERESQEAIAEHRDAALAGELAKLAGVLRAAVAMPPRTLAALRHDVPPLETGPCDEEPAEPRPVWADFAPPEPGLFGRRRHERALTAAQAAFDHACREHDRRRDEAAEARRRAHHAHLAQARHEHEQRWDKLAARVGRRDPDAVAEFAGAVVHAMAPLTGLLAGSRAVYQPEPRELVVEVELPDTDVIPAERSWRYVHTRRSVEALPRRPKDAAPRYADLVAQLTLAVMHGCFQAIPADVADLVTINGHVPTTDPATGRPAHPCLITVTANRTTFDELVLDHERLDPPKCLAFLGAALSRHPYDLEPIEPFVDFDLTQYRLVTAAEALTVLDPRTDLLQMNPYDFERLVKELFSKMGYETWRTESSRDDGIDAVATKADPLMPVECVIQAKRFRKAVPPKEVQALMGAMVEHPTATHGYLVTTSWLSDRSRQRARDQRIITIEGSHLRFLIEEHLGRKVVISNQLPRR